MNLNPDLINAATDCFSTCRLKGIYCVRLHLHEQWINEKQFYRFTKRSFAERSKILAGYRSEM